MSRDRAEMVQLSVRIPADHVDALRDIAADNDRTLSGEIRRLIRLWCDKPESQDGQP